MDIMGWIASTKGVIHMRFNFTPLKTGITWQKRIQYPQHRESSNTKSNITEAICTKQNALELSSKNVLKTKVRNLMQASKVDNNDDKMISQFFSSAISLYSNAEETLQKGVDIARILIDKNATEEEKNSARAEIKGVTQFVDLIGKILGFTFDHYNSATSGKLMKTIGQISDELIKNGDIDNKLSINSIFNFSSESLNIDNLSLDSPQVIQDAFNNALETIRNNRAILNHIYNRYKENRLQISRLQLNEDIYGVDIFI